VIAIPWGPDELSITEWDLQEVRRSYLRRAVAGRPVELLGEEDLEFLAAEVRQSVGEVRDLLEADEASVVDRVGA
jgi:hypothetical protein